MYNHLSKVASPAALKSLSRDELKQMYAWMRPAIAIPMHGEARHLQEHAKLAREAGAKETFVMLDGEVIRLWPGPAAIIDEAPFGRFYRDVESSPG